MNPIRILLIDDQRLFLAALASLLNAAPGMAVIGRAVGRTDGLAAAQMQPDVILLDLALGDECGLELLPELKAASEDSRILIVTALPDPELHLRAIRLGAVGVLLKADPPELLLKAIHKVIAGEVWLNKSMVYNVVSELHSRTTSKTDPDAAKIATLTTRELEVVSLAGAGRRNKQIAERLVIAEKTVRHYLTSIYSKLDVKDRMELMVYAHQHGLAKMTLHEKSVVRSSKRESAESQQFELSEPPSAKTVRTQTIV